MDGRTRPKSGNETRLIKQEDEMQVQNIQDIINDRAMEKAKARMRKIADAIHTDNDIQNFFADVDVMFSYKNEDGKDVTYKESLRVALWPESNNPLYQGAVRAIFPKIASQESELFIAKVESLQSQIEELAGQIPQN